MWKELTGPPRVTNKGLELSVPAAKRGFSLFGGSEGVKMVPITDQASAEVRWHVAPPLFCRPSELSVSSLRMYH